MFTEEEWRLQEKKFKSQPFTKQESRSFNRLFFSGAVDVIPDKQGRVIIPPYLKTYAQIDKDVVVIGVSNRIEVWDQKTWRSFYDGCAESFERIAENIIDAGPNP
jgi:MraZ protein